MSNLIETRKKVYENFPKENLNNESSGIVLFYDINDDNYKALTTATQNFLLKSLSLIHDREFTWTDTFLEDNNVQTRVTFAGNVTRHPVYREYLQEFKNADIVMKNGFLLGAHHGMSIEDVDHVCGLIKVFFNKNK